jgi:hypothetical protein
MAERLDPHRRPPSSSSCLFPSLFSGPRHGPGPPFGVAGPAALDTDCEQPGRGDVADEAGGSGDPAPPVPIPNTVVKRVSADDTRGATRRDNTPSPASPRPLAPARLLSPLFFPSSCLFFAVACLAAV